MGLCMSIDKQNENKRVVLSAEAKAAQLLSQMPGRLCTNGATESCSLHTRQGCKGVNQDSMLVWEGFAAEEGSVFCGVFDGHGPNGHVVASKVRDCLPSLLTLPLHSLLEGFDTPHHHIHEPIKVINNNQANKDQPGTPPGEGNKSEDDDEVEDPAGIDSRFTTAFHKMDEQLKTHPKLSCLSSGTTAVAMVVQKRHLVVGSVGDSRAILVTRDEEDGSLIAVQLTVDLKPDSPGELERIQECQGRVFALEDEPHIARLWLPTANTPGLAMARAFGDFCLKEHGLIATPKIFHRKLTNDDEFIVLATDGVWDVLSNKSVMDAVVSSGSKEEAAKCVVEAAISAWKQRNLASRIDDIAVVCHFLKDKLSPSLASKISKKLKAKESDQGDVKQGNDALEKGDATPHLIRYDTIIDKQELLEPSLQLERVV